jgi:ATP-dependent NAD(P)H-hydrate dehydratase
VTVCDLCSSQGCSINVSKAYEQVLVMQDGLFLITNQPELIIGYPLAILTPNVMEHKRLVAKIVGEKNKEAPTNPREIPFEDLPGQLQELAKKYSFVKCLNIVVSLLVLFF